MQTMTVLRPFFHLVCLLGVGFATGPLYADVRVPEEYESTGGHALAFGGSVASGLGGVSAVRANPALIGLEREYSINGTYHWPTAGRDFYQLGIIDGKTSSVAAGVTYTSAMDDYQGVSASRSSASSSGRSVLSVDSPIVRRGNLAIASPVGGAFLGLSVGYIEARPPAESLSENDSKPNKSFTLGFGLASQLSKSVRLGISAENLANKKIQYAAPTFYRAGLTYLFGDIGMLNLDYRRREAVSVYEGQVPSLALAESDSKKSNQAENLILGSAVVRVYDLLRVIAAVGQQYQAGESSTRVAGGLSLVNQQFNLSYQVMRPDMKHESVHHALALGLMMAM